MSTPTIDAPAAASPLRLPAYRRYLAGTTLFSIGNGVQFVAASWLTLQLGGDAVAVALTLVWATVPGIVCSPFVGVLIDRVNRRHLAAAVSGGRALALCLVPALGQAGVLTVEHIYLSAALVGLADKIYRPATVALLREVVPVGLLLRANSASAVGTQVGAAVGAGVAGLLVAVISAPAVMLVNAAGSLAAALFVASMGGGGAHRAATPAPGGWRQYRADLGDGLRYIDRHRHIIVVYLTALSLLTTLRAVNVLLAPFAERVLQVGAQGFGLIDAAYAVGAIAGASALPWLAERVGRRRTMVWGPVLAACGLAAFSVSAELTGAMGGYAVIGMAMAVYGLYQTVAQEQVALEFQGRVQAAFNVLFGCATLVVYLATGWLAERFDERVLYQAQAVLMIMTAGYAALSLRDTGIRR